VASPVSKSKKWKPFEICRERPAAVILSVGVAAVNKAIETIDPVQLLLADVPQRALAKIVVRVDNHVDLEHAAPPEPFSPTVNSGTIRVK
jgi:hypothetical protein